MNNWIDWIFKQLKRQSPSGKSAPRTGVEASISDPSKTVPIKEIQGTDAQKILKHLKVLNE
jgi:hypothetical protein